MDCLIAKKGEGVGGYSLRCYRLRNCELMQYKKGIENFKLCTDKTIKRRYNIYNISSISLGQSKQPYLLALSYNKNTSVLLKFNEVNKKEKIDHAAFCAWYRVMCSSTKVPYNMECKQRPLPSNTSFSLYYLLQNLYRHKNILNTQFIFQKRLQGTSSNKHVEKLYYNLMVNGRKFSNDLNKAKYDGMDIFLLSKTLIFTLQNMPTSLFCDSYCSVLTTFVADILETAATKKRAQDDYNVAIKQIPEYEDVDIFVMDKESLKTIKEKLLEMYNKNRQQYKKENGFDIFNRYGFLTILFLLLSNISSDKYYKKTTMSAAQLALQFNEALQSKQYLYHCRTETLVGSKTSRGGRKTFKNKRYENQFITMLKIFIYFANDIFPDLRRIKWKVKALIVAQATEKLMVSRYNDNFSRDTKNQYYIPTILRKSVAYGEFDAKYFIDDDPDDNNKNKNHLQTPSKLGGKQYVIQRLPSYNEMPAYKSDIGISDAEDNYFSDDPPQVKEEEEQEEKYGNKNDEKLITQKITFGDGNSDDDGYAQDDEKDSILDGNNQEYDAKIENAVDMIDDNGGDTSWFANCEMCFYAPIMTIFGGGNYDNNYYDDQQPEYDNNNDNNNNTGYNYNEQEHKYETPNNDASALPTQMDYDQEQNNDYNNNKKQTYKSSKRDYEYDNSNLQETSGGYAQTKQSYKEMQYGQNNEKPQINYGGYSTIQSGYGRGGTKIQQYNQQQPTY